MLLNPYVGALAVFLATFRARIFHLANLANCRWANGLGFWVPLSHRLIVIAETLNLAANCGCERSSAFLRALISFGERWLFIYLPVALARAFLHFSLA